MPDGKVIIKIDGDDSGIKQTIDGVGGEAENAAGGMDKLSKSTGDVEKGMGTADIAIGNFVGNALTSLTSKLSETVGNIISLADETREYREDMAKLDTAFTTNGHSVDTAQKTYDGFYKILGESDRTVEAVNHLAAMTSSEEELAQWSDICAGVTSRFGDSLPIEGLTEAANHTAKLGEVQGPLADALEWAGISTEDFNQKLAECDSEQERASLITSTLNGEYAAAAEEYNKLTANTQAARDATNNMEQAQAALGAAIEPVTTAWNNMKANALQWFVDTGLPALQNGWQWIKDNLPAIATIVGGLAAAFLIYNSATIATTVSTWAAQAAQTALNIAQNMSPLGWIVLAITAVVGAFLLLWENCEGFRNFWIGLWEGIKTVLSPVVDWLKQAFSDAWEAIKGVWDFVQPYFVLIWENIKVIFSVVKEWFSGMFSSAWEAIKAVWNIVGAYFSATWDTIKGIFSVVKAVLSGNWSDAWEGIKGIVSVWASYFQTVWDNIKKVFEVVKEWFSRTFQTAWDGIKKIWDNVKQYFSEIWSKIQGVFSAVGTWFSDKFTKAKDSTVNAFSNVKDKFGKIWSNIQGAFSSVGSWFSDKFNEGKDKAVGAFNNIKEKFGEIWTKIKTAFKTGDFLTIGKDLLEGLWNGINDKVAWLKNKVTGVVDKIKSWFTGKDGFDEHSPSKWAQKVAEYVNEGLAIGFESTADIPIKAAENVVNAIKKKFDVAPETLLDTIKGINQEIEDEETFHSDELKRIEDEKNAGIFELWEEYTKNMTHDSKNRSKHEDDYLKGIADINKKYGEDIAKEDSRHTNERSKLLSKRTDVIDGKLNELVSLEEKYKEDCVKIWDDLGKTITDLQADYDNQLASRTKSIAGSLNIWDEATKNKVSGSTLLKNLKSQVGVLDTYNNAIAKLEERNVDSGFIEYLKSLGVSSAGEIEAISKMSDKQLSEYVSLWGRKYEEATEAATEELEPLKAETETKIEEAADGALDKYATLTDKYNGESSTLMEDIKGAVNEAGVSGYEEIIEQIDDYTTAGEDLMGGVIAGITNKSPLVVDAVKGAVTRAIQAAKDAAGIASPSKIMKKEVGANLVEGLNVGWGEKVSALKNKMASDMQGITARLKTVVQLENARMMQGVGVKDNGFTDIAHAVGMQTAGINSLASEYRRGSSAQVTVPLVLNDRELGRAIIDLGNAESVRTGASLSFA